MSIDANLLRQIFDYVVSDPDNYETADDLLDAVKGQYDAMYAEQQSCHG